MRKQATKEFIREHQSLFWYSPEDKTETVTDELLVETIINYGSLENIHKLFEVLGLKETATIFRQMNGRKKSNIYPELRNFFDLYFDKYVPRNS